MTDHELDQDQVQLFAYKVWLIKQAEMVAFTVHLGDRLGLYKAMAGAGRLSAADLAERTGLHERWVLEWLRAQAAADLLETADGDDFELAPESVPALADDGHRAFAAGAFSEPRSPDVMDGIYDSFRTGLGLSYDQLGPATAHQVERLLAPSARELLVPEVLPALHGVVGALEAGGSVADIGCGAGVALELMAEAFPNASFVGYDPSEHALERAQARLARFSNVALHQATAADVPANANYDLVLTFDCLHDMPRPDLAMAAIRAAIAPEGSWLIKDIKCADDYAANQKNPMLALMYATSIATCLQSAMSEPDAAGLGTLGLPPSVARQMTQDAGFTRFQQHDFEDPVNLYYEVRP